MILLMHINIFLLIWDFPAFATSSGVHPKYPENFGSFGNFFENSIVQKTNFRFYKNTDVFSFGKIFPNSFPTFYLRALEGLLCSFMKL